MQEKKVLASRHTNKNGLPGKFLPNCTFSLNFTLTNKNKSFLKTVAKEVLVVKIA